MMEYERYKDDYEFYMAMAKLFAIGDPLKTELMKKALLARRDAMQALRNNK